jgi:predicted amidohydrolase YtcJ
MRSTLMPLLFASVSICFSCCSQKEKTDLLVYNGVIYTVDSSFSIVEAMAIRDGKVIATGKSADLQNKYEAAEKLDARQLFIYPGFIDAHAHFLSYGRGLQEANLVGTASWEEILDTLQNFSAKRKQGWLIGRGWDQNDWQVKEYPTKEKLDVLFPDRPVFLARVDGHAAIANQKALDLAAIKAGDRLVGGDILVKNGQLTGVLIDNAVDLVSAKIPPNTPEQAAQALYDAQANCFAMGLTTIDDCGLNFRDVQLIGKLQEEGKLKMRLFAMLSDQKENYDFAFRNGKIKTDRLNVSSFKVYADGALGSRGACLLQPYSDKPGWYGFLLSTKEHFDSVASVIYDKGWQMCTHAIGDSGNRMILETYAKYLKQQNDRRWRIEHAQVVNQNDFELFGRYGVIPSVQPTHGTSDMYWADDRLGPDRVKGAYAFKQLMDQNGWIPLGTDFPVEDISPFKTFFAAVIRKDAKGFPANGFQVENALSREQALRGMTIWAARSNFEEKEKGSLEVGKFADFIILDQDLMKISDTDILKASVLSTFVGGEKVFERK